MPLPILPIIGGVLGAGAQYFLNKKGNQDAYAQNKEFWDYTHNIQRAEAIADRDYMNQYNSPEAQMRRFREAGLNPNLIYGQQNQMPSVRSSDGQMGNLAPTKLDLSNIGEAINTYMNVETQKQSISNMKKQAEVMDSQKRVNDANALKLSLYPGYIQAEINSLDTKTKKIDQDYIQSGELFQYNLDAKKELIKQISQSIKLSKSQERYNIARTKTENKIRQLKFDIMQADIDLKKAQTSKIPSEISLNEQKLKNLEKEFKREWTKLGVLGTYETDGNFWDFLDLDDNDNNKKTGLRRGATGSW